MRMIGDRRRGGGTPWSDFGGLAEVRPVPPAVAALDEWALPMLVGLLLGLGTKAAYGAATRIRTTSS